MVGRRTPCAPFPCFDYEQEHEQEQEAEEEEDKDETDGYMPIIWYPPST
jgi:hypothetical protein